MFFVTKHFLRFFRHTLKTAFHLIFCHFFIHLKNQLKGIAEDPNDVPQFTNFMLAAEPVSTNPNHQTPLGIITVKNGDPMVMYSGRCRNSIKESSSSMKSQISV